MSDVICPSCAVSNPAGSQFCEACGADLPGAAPPGGAASAAAGDPNAAADPTGTAADESAAAPESSVTQTAPTPAAPEHIVVPAEEGTTDATRAAPVPTPGTDPVSGTDPTLEGEPPEKAPSPGHAPGDGPGPGGPAPVSNRNLTPAEIPGKQASATPVPPVAGEESPLDVGWTGVVSGRVSAYESQPVAATCTGCGAGNYLDGYCDNCGAKEPNPRDHFEESPAPWVGGVCDIGKRHATNEDGMALSAGPDAGSRAVLVVCDGVSNTTLSHVASMNAATAARSVLDKALPAGVGTPEATQAAAVKRLTEAVDAANRAVIATVADTGDPSPPSCTFTGAIVTGTTAHVGNVGDSRIYWLPDAAPEAAAGAEQLSRDDSFAADRIAAGVERKEAETGPMAHSITRWLGIDAPDDLTPHTRTITVDRPGWLLVCSDGLWNYCSEASQLQTLIATLTEEGKASTPTALAGALVDFANNAGGADNITVALARLADPAVEGKEESRG